MASSIIVITTGSGGGPDSLLSLEPSTLELLSVLVEVVVEPSLLVSAGALVDDEVLSSAAGGDVAGQPRSTSAKRMGR